MLVMIAVVHYLAQRLVHCCLDCDLSTCNDSGRALLGLAVDPFFRCGRRLRRAIYKTRCLNVLLFFFLSSLFVSLPSSPQPLLVSKFVHCRLLANMHRRINTKVVSTKKLTSVFWVASKSRIRHDRRNICFVHIIYLIS